MSRSDAARRLWGTAVLIAAVLLDAGCGGFTPADRTAPPPDGSCHALTAAALSRPSDSSAAVACTKAHTTLTYLVGTVPKAAATGYRSQPVSAYVYRTCRAGFLNYLGIDDSLALRVDLSWAWFGPSREGWDAGARWFRCDLVGGASGASTLRPLPTQVRTLFHGVPPDAWLRCRAGADFTTAAPVPCSAPHNWRAVSAIKLGTPDAAYPGDRFSQVRARDYCSDAVIAWLDYPPTYAYGYTVFHRAEWEAGNRRALCWAGTDR